eukprot:1174040-Prorocentrum_minimum.AAC.1
MALESLGTSPSARLPVTSAFSSHVRQESRLKGTAEPTSRKEVIGGRQQLGRKALKRILSTKRAVGGIHAGILVRFGYVNVQVLLNIIALLATRGSSAARRCTTRTRAPQLHVSS